MFLKATRFSFLAVKFNYASLFFHLTFRRIIQDMKVNLQILFRIFCKYPVVSLSCGIFHMKLCLLNSDTELLTPATNQYSLQQKILEAHTHKASQISINNDLFECSELCPCHPQMVTLYHNIFWKQVTDLLVPK